ncbi:lysoplasmalogenase [Moritella sp. F3]|uniref:lysoplasmalogenase n=1 Tax=Moritella sp. F3 TaxID=2718882 RepID=UPI0018E1B39F|nr:lysoplasmalogenase [Moritella sp. F3]GIC78344.1 membrane protein [Moritella sp. F1]GIC83723.1 membrane protein [Moritella sp. F3]
MDVTTTLITSTLGIFVCALLHLYGAYKEQKWLFYVFKPVTTLAIVALCWHLSPALSDYVWFILLGLLLSTLGDIFLMLPKDRFIPGLLSFLVAHVAYIVAFSMQFEMTYTWTLIAPLMIIAILYLTILWSSLAEMKAPVLVYMSIIVVMAWVSGERYFNLESSASLYAFIGAIVFLFSDATLAFDRFKKQFHSAYGVIIVSYYLAQYFIALSVA